MRSNDVTRAMEAGAMSYSADVAEVLVDRLTRRREEILATYLPPNAGSVRDALATGVLSVVEHNERIAALIEAVRGLALGRQVAFTGDGEVLQGIVTRIDYPKSGYEHVPSMRSEEHTSELQSLMTIS